MAVSRPIDVPGEALWQVVCIGSLDAMLRASRDSMKVFDLVDDVFASVVTANAGNRSFRLDFKISMAVLDKGFAKEVETMLERDFAQCRQAGPEDFANRGLGFRLAVKVARLLSPIL